MCKPNNASWTITQPRHLSGQPQSSPFPLVSQVSEPSFILYILFYDLFILRYFHLLFHQFILWLYLPLFILYMRASSVLLHISTWFFEFLLLPHAANTAHYLNVIDHSYCKSLTVCSNGSVSGGCSSVCGLLRNGTLQVCSYGDCGLLP